MILCKTHLSTLESKGGMMGHAPSASWICKYAELWAMIPCKTHLGSLERKASINDGRDALRQCWHPTQAYSHQPILSGLKNPQWGSACHATGQHALENLPT